MSQTDLYPKISIILPTYNRANLILETISSVSVQTYQNWELLIIDDVSDDNTADLIAVIEDKRVKFYRTDKRLGIAGSRNEGLKRVTGEMIAFIDSDDLWAATKLEKQVAAMFQYPGAGFSLTNGFDFKALNEPISFFYKQREGFKYGNIFLSFFKSEAAATTPSLLIRRQCMQVVGSFKEPNSIHFFLDLASHFDAVILYESLFYRRVHESNYSTINQLKRHTEGINMIRSYKNRLPSQLFRESLFKSYINFGEKCLLQKERRRAIINFFKAWQSKPFSIIPFKKAGKAVIQYFK